MLISGNLLWNFEELKTSHPSKSIEICYKKQLDRILSKSRVFHTEEISRLLGLCKVEVLVLCTSSYILNNWFDVFCCHCRKSADWPPIGPLCRVWTDPPSSTKILHPLKKLELLFATKTYCLVGCFNDFQSYWGFRIN